MPIYEYQCTSCDCSFEKRQGFEAEPVCNCPQCQSEAKRLFKPAPIIFKGKGFYVTDYPSNSSTSARGKSEESSEVVATKASESTSDSKSTAVTATPSSGS